MKYNRHLRRKMLKKIAFDPKDLGGMDIKLPENILEPSFDEDMPDSEMLDSDTKQTIINKALNSAIDRILDKIEQETDPEMFE